MKFNILFLLLLFSSGSVFCQKNTLRDTINKIIRTKNAKVGVAIAGIGYKDTLTINGDLPFPMFSVVKFHTAITVLDRVDRGVLSLDSMIHFVKSDLDTNTHSPLRDKNTQAEFDISIRQLLSYDVSQSDNIAYEKLVELLGGIGAVNDFIHQLNIQKVSLVSTYKDGYEATLKNVSSPEAATQLLVMTYKESFLSKKSHDFLWQIMFETVNGPNRIKGLLPGGTLVAHKTGTSGVDENGMTAGFNDIGVVTLSNGKHFAISVFITDSKETEEVNAAIIAEISKAVWDFYMSKK